MQVMMNLTVSPSIYQLLPAILKLILFYCIDATVLFESNTTIDFSGTSFGDSTGWIYSETIDNSIQWGRLYYKMNEINALNLGDRYVHITFMAINNGIGVYSNGITTNTQQMRIVDSVGSTLKMIQTPYASVQYLLNIDTGTYGELNRDTEYIYYYDNKNWTCMEWYTNSNTQEIQLYENSILTYQVNNDLTFNTNGTGITATFTIPQSQDIRIGMYTYNGISVSGKFKDVKIADERIGCNNNNNNNNDDDNNSPTTTTTVNNNNNNNNGIGDIETTIIEGETPQDNLNINDDTNNGSETGLGHDASFGIAFGVVLTIIIIILVGGFMISKKINKQKLDSNNNGVNSAMHIVHITAANARKQTNIVPAHTSQDSNTNIVFKN